MEYKAVENLTVETIIKRGVTYFFPQGKSQLGDLKDMEVSLASFAGENLQRFTDSEGNTCSFQEYLKSHGLFSSQYHLYIRTKEKQQIAETACTPAALGTDENVEEEMVTDQTTSESDETLGEETGTVLLVNNNIPGNIELKYKKKIISRYDETECSISCSSMRQCYNSSAHEHDNEDYSSYNCITDDGFLLTHVEKDKKLYLTELEDGSYQLYSFTSSQNPEIIMHGPDEINGLNDGDLMLGLITPLHNKNILYQWYKDGHLVFEGINASVLKVTNPGEYSVGINVNGQFYTFGVHCSVTEHVLPRRTGQLDILNTLTQQPSQSLSTLSQVQGIQKQTFTTKAQTFTNTHSCNTQQHTLSTQSQTFTTESHTFSTQSCSSQQQTSTTESHTFSTQPQIFTTQQQEFTAQSHTFITQPQTFSTQSQSFITQPQTFSTQPCSTQPEIFTTQSLTYTTQHQTCTTQSQPFTTMPQALTTQQQTFSTQPQTFTTQAHLFSTQPKTFSSQPRTLSSQPQTNSSVLQTTAKTPQTSGVSLCTVPRVDLADVNLGKEIGRGGSGIVYKGCWIGTKVAVKEIVIKRMKISKQIVDRELCVHSQLRHPNIVMLMAFAMESDRLYLVSELIDGVTLDNCLFGVDAPNMNMSVKLNVSLKISQAIAYLHAQNPLIIHRDIKPENILVANNFNVVKLCDMGLSKLKTMNTVMTTMAGICLQPGTPSYQAPEILLEKRSASTMTDSWSLACTLVEVMVEIPIWNSADEPVQYVMDRMKLKARPDGLVLLATLASNDYENVESKIYSILDRGLNYSADVRPEALHIVNYFHGLLGDN